MSRAEQKVDLEDAIVASVELPRNDASVVVETIFDTMAESLQRGENVFLRGFGTFGVRRRKARTGRNPKTGEKVHVPAKRIVFFKPGLEIRRLLGS